MVDAPPTTTPPLLLDRYRIIEPIGEWRLATVYGAFDERLQRQVMLHLLRKELAQQEQYRRRFIAEIEATARLIHPALIDIFDSGEIGKRPFMVTDYVEGRPLREIGILTIDQALLYMRQVIGAVSLCQSHRSPQLPAGAPHPPITSSNLWVVGDGRVRLIESWLLPTSQVPLEIAHYRPPERSQGQPITTASAVYSLGILLYELISGRRPFTGTDARNVALAHLNSSIAPLDEIRPTLYLPSLQNLLDRALTPNPADRFSDVDAFGNALEAFWREMSATTQRLIAPPVAPRSTMEALRSAATSLTTPASRRPAPNTPRQPIASQSNPQTAVPSRQPRLNLKQYRQRDFWQGTLGVIILIALLFTAGLAGYVGIRYLLDRVETGWVAPWDGSGFGLPGSTTGEALIVNNELGLNLRAEPGIDTEIVAIMPNGQRLIKIAGPEVIDNVPWVQVRVDLGQGEIEGWASMIYLIAER